MRIGRRHRSPFPRSGCTSGLRLPLYVFSGGNLLCARLHLALAGARWAKAQCGTLRVRWLKVAARVKITARKVWVSFASAYPYRDEFAAIAQALREEPARAPPA